MEKLVARTTTKLTPAQLEEFESTFRHFDREQTNTLGLAEFSAALSALGIIYSDDDTYAIHSQLAGEEGGTVDFQAWIDFLVRACARPESHRFR
jgi:Ca2+-binding EF-hand superfamily protein